MGRHGGPVAPNSLQNCCQSGLDETRFSTSFTATKPFSLLFPLSSLLYTTLSPLYNALSSIQRSLLYAKPVSLLSHCVSVESVPDACGYGRFVSVTISSQEKGSISTV